MKRLMILGGPGSGKSTLAKQLHAVTGLPLFHLDQLYWRPCWVAPPNEEWPRLLAEIAAREEWIMDGGYGNSFYLRMPRAETILWLDLPLRVCFPRVLKRMAVNYGRQREDIRPGCPERFDFTFLKWAWTWQRAHRVKYRSALAEHPPHANVRVFASRREADNFLSCLS